MRTSTVIKAVLAATALTPLLCQAESNLATGGGGGVTATAHVDFQITIPKFLFLRIGTGPGTVAGGWASGGNIDLITFTPTPAQLGTGSLAAASGGDISPGVETAVVAGNDGDVTLSSTTAGAMGDGSGDTISWATITTTPAHNTTGTMLLPPALADGATTSITLTSVAKIVQQDAKWTYAYTNATIPPAGTYGGAGGTNNGRVTYTASAP